MPRMPKNPSRTTSVTMPTSSWTAAARSPGIARTSTVATPSTMRRRSARERRRRPPRGSPVRPVTITSRPYDGAVSRPSGGRWHGAAREPALGHSGPAARPRRGRVWPRVAHGPPIGTAGRDVGTRANTGATGATLAGLSDEAAAHRSTKVSQWPATPDSGRPLPLVEGDHGEPARSRALGTPPTYDPGVLVSELGPKG